MMKEDKDLLVRVESPLLLVCMCVMVTDLVGGKQGGMCCVEVYVCRCGRFDGQKDTILMQGDWTDGGGRGKPKEEKANIAKGSTLLM